MWRGCCNDDHTSSCLHQNFCCERVLCDTELQKHRDLEGCNKHFVQFCFHKNKSMISFADCFAIVGQLAYDICRYYHPSKGIKYVCLHKNNKSLVGKRSFGSCCITCNCPVQSRFDYCSIECAVGVQDCNSTSTEAPGAPIKPKGGFKRRRTCKPRRCSFE